MRSPSREDILTAFAARVNALEPFVSTSRRATLDPLDLTRISFDQPAIVLLEHDEETERRGRGLPPVLILDVMVCIYARIPRDEQDPSVPDATIPGATVINPLIEVVEAMFEPDNPLEGVCTLGGLVSHAWIEGKTIKVVGDITPNGQCFAGLPARLMLP
jgi:hypothetical protein